MLWVYLDDHCGFGFRNGQIDAQIRMTSYLETRRYEMKIDTHGFEPGNKYIYKSLIPSFSIRLI